MSKKGISRISEFSEVKLESDSSVIENSKQINYDDIKEELQDCPALINCQNHMTMIKNEPELQIESDPLDACLDTAIEEAFNGNQDNRWRDSHTKSRYDCRFCPVYYQSKRQLFGHVRQVHLGETTTTETIYEKCLKIGSTSSTLFYKCKKCDSPKTVDYSSFKRHVYLEHEPNKNCRICDHCDGIYANKFALVRHIKKIHYGVNSKKLTCEQCAQECADQRTLERHQQNKHGSKCNDKKAMPVIRVPKIYQCEFCPKIYYKVKSLWWHNHEHHRKELMLPPKIRVKREVQCNLCPRKFKWHSNLSRHRRKDHYHVKYNCQKCNQSYDSKTGLYYHSFTHVADMRFNCRKAECGYKTMVRAMFIKHLKQRHDTVYQKEEHDLDLKKYSYTVMTENCFKPFDSELSDDEEREFYGFPKEECF